MKLPDTVRIAGFDYEIVQVPADEIPKVEGLEDQTLCGCIDYHEEKIFIGEEYSDQRKTETTLHEIIHGIVIHYGVPVTDELHEPLVEAITCGLYQVLKDNPKIVKLFK